MKLKTAVPQPIRVALHPVTWRLRRPSLIRGLRRLAAEEGRRLPTLDEAQQLFVKWSNSDATAAPHVVVEVARLCRDADGPILECGSGLTTFIAAIYARHGCWSLEDNASYRQLVVDTLQRAGLDGNVLHAPLVDHGDCDWYQLPEVPLPDRFAAVICDGPIGRTRGGRSGLLVIMRDRIAGAEVILDDADRHGEQQAIRRWEQDFGVTHVRTIDRAALLRVPEAVPPPSVKAGD